VYPIPINGGLGIHATVDVEGNVRFGPDAEWLRADTNGGGDVHNHVVDPFRFTKVPDFQLTGLYNVDETRESIFYDSIRKYYPSLPEKSLVPDYSGIRPKLRGPYGVFNSNSAADAVGRDLDDCLIEGHNQHGVKGLVNLFGIESPGLTSSLAIGDYVAKMVKMSL